MKDSTWFDAVTLLLIALMSIAAGVPAQAGDGPRGRLISAGRRIRLKPVRAVVRWLRRRWRQSIMGSERR